MSKRYGNLWSKITDIDNIKNAHLKARKDKRFYEAVQKTNQNLDERAEKIQKMLVQHSYKVSPYRTSILHDKTKDRILFKLPYYPDRIIQWAIMLQIEHIFLETFTDFTCASIPKRGVHYASKKLSKMMNNDIEGTKYCLKLDIKKFYPSIDRPILKKLLRKKIKDKDLLFELDKIIDSMERTNLDKIKLSTEMKELYSRPNKGLPVGSYLSQYLANYYLTYFDHWLKEELHIKYVIRYMDDIVILSSSKEELWKIFYQIKDYLKNELELEVKSNYQIFPTAIRGIDFVGYRHFYGYKLLRKTASKRCKKVMIKMYQCQKNKILPSEKLWCSWVSYVGWLQWCNSYYFYYKYCNESVPIVNTFYNLNKRGNHRKINYQFYIYNNFKKKDFFFFPKIVRSKIHRRYKINGHY